VGTESDLQGGI